jgi:copper chaperone CopZ
VVIHNQSNGLKDLGRFCFAPLHGCRRGAILRSEGGFMDKTNTERARDPGEQYFETKQIAIDGMTCDNCVRTVERALRDTRGVTDVQVDRENALATVTFDTRATDIPALHDALMRHGYRPTPVAV